MAKRYYYDCPIQALYMMKEFGVKFYCESGEEEIREFELKGEDGFCPFEEIVLEAEMIDDLLTDFKDFGKIYAFPESEHIFEPKEGDFVSNFLHGNKGRHCHGFLGAQSSLTRDAAVFVPERHNGKNYFVEEKSQLTIILRDNKHFFTPKVEGEK